MSEDYLLKVKASIVESSKDFVGIADAGGRILYLNGAAYEMMGYSATDRPDFKTLAEVHANDFDKFALEVIQPAVFQKGYWTGVGILRHKNGGVLTVSQSVFPVFDEKGVIYGTAAIMKDISDVVSLSRQINKNSELFQKVLDSAKIGIVLINMESQTIEMVNRFTQELLQTPADKIVGRKCHKVLCHADPSLCPHVNERDKETIVAERFIRRPDGSMVPIIKTGTWITIDDKEYLVDTFVDISIQKELEKGFLEAKISAEAANRSKSEFLSRMSHEMRTPLNAIIGMVQITGRTDNVDKLKEAMNTIETSSNHLLGLINDILDLSKIEEGKLELNIEPFSPKLMLDKIISLIVPKAEEKGVSFTMKADDALPESLEGDSMRLSQVLLNFLSNAVKFTPKKGSINLDVSCKPAAGNKVSILFSVKDNGIGMTSEQLSRLFSPFTQADGSISRKFGGTGLGLVISKRIVNLMNSDIEVETVYGEGTRFSFSLTMPVSGKLAPEDHEFDPVAIGGLFSGKRALIVDDVALNRIVARELLSVTGVVSDEAADGREALEMAAGNSYDIILMDVQMPVMDGYEATRQIRALSGVRGHTPIVAMSANVFKDDVERSLAAGMDGHIGKPVDLRNMVETMKSLLFPAVEPFPAGTAVAAGDKISPAEMLYGRLISAMAQQDYGAATTLSKELQLEADKVKAPSISSYAGNVHEWLAQGHNKYAEMYMADLARAFEKFNNEKKKE